MKNQIIIFIMVIAFTLIKAQAPDWQWAKAVGGGALDYGQSISTDPAGNVFVAGNFQSATINLGSNILTNAGGNDIYLIKYDKLGNVLWAKSAGGASNETAYGVSADANGNVFITGSFYSSSLAFGTTTLPCMSSNCFFVTKYDNAGNVQWAKSASGGIAYGVSACPNGDVLVTGSFSTGQFAIGGTTLTNTSSPGLPDFFVARYDPNGMLLWANSAGGSATEVGRGVSVDPNGNTLVTGAFTSSVVAFGSTTLASSGNYDMFVAKYDASGNLLWVTSAAGSSSEDGKAIATDAGGNSFITGTFMSTNLYFGSIALYNSSTSGSSRLFLVKYDPNGTPLWAKDANAAGVSSYGNGVATDAAGNTYITGDFFGNSLGLGSIFVSNSTPGSAETFVAKHSSAGNLQWVIAVGGTNPDVGLAISADNSGNAFVTGHFKSSSMNCGTITINNSGDADMFVGKLGSNPVGVDQQTSSEPGYKIFPNPVTDKLYVTSQNNSPISVSIINSLGQIVFKKNDFDASQYTDVSQFQSGIYFLEIRTDKTRNVLKLLKE